MISKNGRPLDKISLLPNNYFIQVEQLIGLQINIDMEPSVLSKSTDRYIRGKRVDNP